jgi:CheY-like chemotaxis protein
MVAAAQSKIRVPSDSPARRVLVVDDELDTAETLAVLLRQMGHEVEFAINARAALDLAERHRPQIVFLDLGLPDMDGWDLARRLKRLPGLESLRILAVTGRYGEEFRRRSIEAGCEQHLVKPLDVSFLENLMR